MSQTIPPILSVLPTRALVDEKFKVLVENLPAGSPVTLHSLHHSEDKDYWEAYAHYISDHRGTVSVAEDLSFGGTYAGIEPMGLLWSMRPVPGSQKGRRLRKTDVHSPMLVNISVYSGHIAEGFREQPPLASALTERWYMAPGVRRIDIREKGVRGTLFIPPGPGPFPGLMDMWGIGGGLIERRSALLASHGYVSLALEYFSPGELKSAELEFKYFEAAFNIVKDHPQVIPDRVGIFGISLGATFTMYLAAESTIIKPWCCVCVNGGHFYPRGETLSAFYKMIMRNSHKVRVDENDHQIWRDVTLPITSDLSRKVDVRKINCPVLLVSGHDDQNIPAVESAEDVAQMMHTAGKDHLLTRLHYPDTGHVIEPPYSPHFRATNFIIESTKAKAILLMGGQTKPHSDAQEDSWRKILAFLQQHLYSTSIPKAKMMIT
ncbi:peroxisomal succinyl-coenzyme A thioesterase-like [Thunnus thynnus]|uniref:peroxisomal succinyl-coenzyme A thioesterase-like n=1 Tax=Thunnus thynnus TaxID=8237 RepID=UPI003526FA4A